MGSNNANSSAVGAKLLFGALQVVSLMQLMSDGGEWFAMNLLASPSD